MTIIIFYLLFCFAFCFIYFFSFYSPIIDARIFWITQLLWRRQEFISLWKITHFPRWWIRSLKRLICQSFLALQTLLVWDYLGHLTCSTLTFSIILPYFTITLLRTSRLVFEVLIPTLFSFVLRIFLFRPSSFSYFLHSFLLVFDCFKII